MGANIITCVASYPGNMFYVSYESGCWLMMLHNDDEEEGIAELTQKLQGGDGRRPSCRPSFRPR